MASRERPLAPRPQAPLPAAADQPGSGPGKLRPEPRRSTAGGGGAAGPVPERPGRGPAERAAPPRPPPACAGRAGPAGGPGAPAARGWVAARAPCALAFSPPVPSSTPSSFYFWPPPPPPPPSLLPSSSAFPLPVRLPGRAGAAAAAARGGGGDAGGGQAAAPVSGSRGTGPGGGGGRRRLLLSPALQGLLLPARAGPWPLPPRLPLGPATRRAGSPGFPGVGGGCPGLGSGAGGGCRTPRRPRGAGFALAAAAPLLFGADMDDGAANSASCFRRLTECFLSPK
uniref:Uncharacterized protein n=1 Tax=Rousettus aegyptiacus TaxID=9407 RepID=A0A7J8KE35_ROUAE|nr:hypothetical protein HJG63_015048 [Rousettus aegyptiacus]